MKHILIGAGRAVECACLSLSDSDFFYAELAVDVPNGKYRVRMQLEDPGAWEFMQNYRKRSVTAEGKVVLEETMDAEEFLKRFFRNQDTEDLPTEDPFEKYVESRHPWKEFDVEVADGQLTLGLQSADTCGATLSALVISPLDQEEKTKQFMAFVKELRIIAHSAGTVKPHVSDAVFERNITVTSSASRIAMHEADDTLGLVLTSQKNMMKLCPALAKGEWRIQPGMFKKADDTRGCTVGVISASWVGKFVMKLLPQFLDVYDSEPPPPGSPLYGCPNLTLTPRIAGSAGRGRLTLGGQAFCELKAFLTGQPVQYSVTQKMLATMA